MMPPAPSFIWVRWLKLGRLTYLGPARAPKFVRDHGSRWGWFHCECGTVKRVRLHQVASSRSRSCGCNQRVTSRRWVSSSVAEAMAKRKAAL